MDWQRAAAALTVGIPAQQCPHTPPAATAAAAARHGQRSIRCWVSSSGSGPVAAAGPVQHDAAAPPAQAWVGGRGAEAVWPAPHLAAVPEAAEVPGAVRH